MAIPVLLTAIMQKINGVTRKILPETVAKQVFMDDGTDLETKLKALANAVSGQTTTYVVSDIAARDAIGSPHSGDQAWVKDATADETVKLGAAKYIFDGESWVKTAEAESMDLVFKWADIQDKPVNSAADIDKAVNATKTLDGHELTVSEDSGDLLVDGNAVGGQYGAYVNVAPEDEGFEAAVAALNLPDGAFFTVAQDSAGGSDNSGAEDSGEEAA